MFWRIQLSLIRRKNVFRMTEVGRSSSRFFLLLLTLYSDHNTDAFLKELGGEKRFFVLTFVLQNFSNKAISGVNKVNY